MEVKVATVTSFHSTIPQCPSFSQTLTTSKRRGIGGYISVVASQNRLKPCPAFLGTQSAKLQRLKSCELWQISSNNKIGIVFHKHSPLRRVCSASSSHFKIAGEEDLERNKGITTVKLLLEESVPGLASLEAPWMEMVNHTSIERKANSVDLPLSLRMIKKKLAEEAALKEASDCSINKAFSSMVFMIEELHSFALHAKDLRHIKKDMHASLLWIFQHVFSQTPTFMVYVMILLANFTVHSVASNIAITDQTKKYGGIREDELCMWNSIVEEADQMHNSPNMSVRLVTPINTKIELDDYANYTRTEYLYELGLTQDPNNALLLANYAQFLYLITQDYDRAEKYFKKAIELEEVDGEAYNKYAVFQWKARKDLWAAEENFLEAISTDPDNSFYASNYANFLWQTGGEETCFPLDSPHGMA